MKEISIIFLQNYAKNWMDFLKNFLLWKICVEKKIYAPFAVYFHALLVWLSSSLHSRACSTLLQAMIALAFLLNAPMNHWEFSDWSGHSWTSSYFVWALGNVQLTIPCHSSPGLFKVHPLHAWPCTQHAAWSSHSIFSALTVRCLPSRVLSPSFHPAQPL